MLHGKKAAAARVHVPICCVSSSLFNKSKKANTTIMKGGQNYQLILSMRNKISFYFKKSNLNLNLIFIFNL